MILENKVTAFELQVRELKDFEWYRTNNKTSRPTQTQYWDFPVNPRRHVET